MINKCRVYNCDDHGIYWHGLTNSHVGLIYHTTLEGNDRSGLYSCGAIDEVDGGTISGCTIQGNGEWGIHVYAESDGKRSPTSTPLIEFCDITNN